MQGLLQEHGAEVLEGKLEEDSQNRLLTLPVAWSPDGKSLYYLLWAYERPVDLEVWRYDIYKQAHRKIAVIPYAERYQGYHLGLEAPDSRWNAGASKLAFTLDYAWGRRDLIILDLEKPEQVKVIAEAPEFDWQPEGEKISFVRGSENHNLSGLLFGYSPGLDSVERRSEIAGPVNDLAYDARGRIYLARGREVLKLDF